MSKKNRERGKRYERFIASDLGGRRVGILGDEDVSLEGISAECKERQKLPEFIKKCMAQALTNCADDKMPVVFLHEHNTLHSDDVVMMPYLAFKELYLGK